MVTQELESTEIRKESTEAGYTNPDDLIKSVWRSIRTGSIVADTVVKDMQRVGLDLSFKHLSVLAKCGIRGARGREDVVAKESLRIRREALRMQRDRGLIP